MATAARRTAATTTTTLARVMTVQRSLQLVLMAALPSDVKTCEGCLTEISRLLPEVAPDSPLYRRAHRRLDDLLTLRDRLLEAEDPGGRVKVQ